MRPRFSRPLLLALAALVLAPALAPAAGVTLVRVWPEYRSAESFVRIAEYFGGRESAPETIVRSQPGSRAGYYFLARFKAAAVLPGTILALEYVLPGDEESRVQFFPIDLPKGSRAVLAGLTGADWPGETVRPTAWRLRLLSSSGAELAREQSFLWSLPTGEKTAAAPAPDTNAIPAPTS